MHITPELYPIVISDLDGTLLDHHTYDHSPALPALQLLASLNVPLILSSSKTEKEIASIRTVLNNDAPYIVENGAAIHIPQSPGKTEIICLGLPRARILEKLDTIRNEFANDYTGMSDMHVDEVSQLTGLNSEQAEMAKQRAYTEPFIWHAEANRLAAFSAALSALGLSLTRGGRFYHISGTSNKGAACIELRKYYEQQYAHAPFLIALGDSDNDREMLEAADVAIRIRNPERELPTVDHKHLITSDEYGPSGWNQCMLALFKEKPE